MDEFDFSAAEITYSDDVPDDKRETIRKSVAALVERSYNNRARQLVAKAELRAYRVASQDHLKRQIESDPESKESIEEACRKVESENFNKRRRTQKDALSQPPLDENLVRGANLLRFGDATKIFWSPFHFDWRWSYHDGAHSLTIGTSVGSPGNPGYAGISADVNTDVAHVGAHAGVGVALTVADVNSQFSSIDVMGRSLRWARHQHSVLAAPGNGDSLSEGGVELTVMKDGKFLAEAQPPHKLWRRRLSNGEYGDGGNLAEGMQLDDPSLSVFWRMEPGSTYTLNLGVWVFVDTDDGIYGNGWANGFIDSNIAMLSVFK